MILPSVPAQEADKSLGGMIRQARQQVGETGLRIDVVEPSQAKIYTDEADRKRARLDQGVHGAGGRSRAIGVEWCRAAGGWARIGRAVAAVMEV